MKKIILLGIYINRETKNTFELFEGGFYLYNRNDFLNMFGG